MFGLGGGEIGILFLVILLLFGPSALPKLARGLGDALREFRKAQREIRDEIRDDDAQPKPPDQKPTS